MSTRNKIEVNLLTVIALSFCLPSIALRWNPKHGIPDNLTTNQAAVLNYIRNTESLLFPPSTLDYNLGSSINDPSMGQSDLVRKYLNNMKNGFFVECGAFDGFGVSNTLNLEKNFGWNGLLVEADPKNYELLQKKNRKAWTVNACLATHKYSHKVLFQQNGHLGRIYDGKKGKSKPNKKQSKNKTLVEIQCIPLTDLLLALNVTIVDYFSLDVEGSELEILKTILLDKVFIKIISVECTTRKKQKAVTKFLLRNGYKPTAQVNNEHDLLMDLMFVHESLDASNIYSAKPEYIKGTLKS